MKILAFSDLHGDLDKAKKIASLTYDLALCAGDMGSYDAARKLAQMFHPFFYVQGNWDRFTKKVEGAQNLHRKIKQYKGYTFVGHGWFHEGRRVEKKTKEQVIQQLLKESGPGSIVVTHQKISLSSQPKLYLYGHSHKQESFMQEETYHVNAGSLEKGEYALIRLKDIKVDLRSI